MKKLFVLLPILILIASSAMAALQFTLSDYDVNVVKGTPETLTLTATNDGATVSGVSLLVSKKCKETTAPTYRCNSGDTMNPTGISISTTSPTDSNGEATVTISADSAADNGDYHYTICTSEGVDSTCSIGAASVTGDFAAIPEFTTIGAGIALVGASLYYLKKRK